MSIAASGVAKASVSKATDRCHTAIIINYCPMNKPLNHDAMFLTIIHLLLFLSGYIEMIASFRLCWLNHNAALLWSRDITSYLFSSLKPQ